MSSEALAWLTVDLVEKVLKNLESDDTIEVKDLTTKPAVGKGDNYGSELIRAGVKYSRDMSGSKVMDTISIIVKIAPMTEGSTKELIEKFRAFETEINMMQTTLPQMNDILNDKDHRLSPRLLYAEIGEPSFIVMEDLVSLGYRMADRCVGLDLEHCLLAMRNLAKFHASTVALSEKGTRLEAMYKNGMFHADYPEHWKQFFASGIKSLATEVLNWSELGDERLSYSDKLSKFSEVCYERVLECVNQKNNEFNVLNHGDFWLNNMLFRYDDEGKLTDHIFVDFQISVWNSPAIDILNFFNDSLTEDVEVHHREDLLCEYLNVLTKTMSKLGCNKRPLTMEALDKTVKDYELYGFMTSCVLLPLSVLDRSEFVSFDDMVQDDEFMNPSYKGQAYRKIMLRRLPVWNARGLFDV